MSDTKTRKYRCNGCGEDRPCYLTTNQEPHTLDYMQLEDLKCVLNETNQTSYNWQEIQANEYECITEQALHKYIVSNSALAILEASKVLLKFDYTPTLGQEWLLAEKGKMTVLHRAKSKEELVNYVIEHYC